MNSNRANVKVTHVKIILCIARASKNADTLTEKTFEHRKHCEFKFWTLKILFLIL